MKPFAILLKRLSLLSFIVLFALPAYANKHIEHWKTPKGLNVLFLPAPEIPMLDIRLLVDAGSIQDGPNAGLATLTSELIGQETKSQTTDEIAHAFDSVGANFMSSLDRDYATLGLRSLSDTTYFKPAFKQFLTILRENTFREKSFARTQQQQLTAIKASQQSPGAIASEAFFQALYGTHPYGQPVAGTLESVEALTIEQVQDFYNTHYSIQGATLAIVGALDTAQAKALAKQIEDALPNNKKDRIALKKPAKVAHKAHIEYPSSQTHMLYGTLGVERGHPDYFPLYVGNNILGGGGMVSLLFDEVREKQGLAYSVYSYFLPLLSNGPFIIGAQTRNEAVEKTEKTIEKTLFDFVAQGPSEQQLVDAKRYITGNFPLRINSNSSLVSYLAVIGYYDLPLTYLDDFNDKINQVTTTQIQTAFKKHLDKNKMIQIDVGQTLEKQST